SWRGKSWRSIGGSLSADFGNRCSRLPIGSRRDIRFIRYRSLLTATCFFVLVVADVVPLLSLFVHSLPLSRYAKVWNSHTTEIVNTALLPLVAAGGAVALAFAGTMVVERVIPRWQNVLTLCVLLPVAVPPVLVGIALIALYNRPACDAIYGTKAIVVLGYLGRFLPFAFVAVRGAVQSLDVAWEEAAQVEGATWGQSLWHVTRPLAAPGLRAAGLLVFVLSAGELSVTLLVNPPGGQTIPFTIDNFMHFGHTPEVATLGMMLAAMTVGAALMWQGTRRLARLGADTLSG
ncbi:MAG: ABC transporter permease subunit, partial [Abditibacteriales bacterium]|nr:ABC transporter permease subunit [Abditibacteriales bacterium]